MHAPLGYPADEFKLGARDVNLGQIAGCDFYVGGK